MITQFGLQGKHPVYLIQSKCHNGLTKSHPKSKKPFDDPRLAKTSANCTILSLIPKQPGA